MEKRILSIAIGMVTSLMILSGCAVQKQETKAIQEIPPTPILISGTVVSDTGESILGAKIFVQWGWPKEMSKEVLTGADGRFALELPRKPRKIEASKPGYFRSTIEPDAKTILNDLRFVLESGGRIMVTIKGLDKEDLKFLRVKAIAGGKEYRRSDSMFIGVKFDGRGMTQADAAKDGVSCEILGVPGGPAEVFASFNEISLPSQTVEVKGGTVVNVNFEFKLNRFTLSGILTYRGKPLSNWLLIFKRMDGKATPGISGVTTPADGWYEIKLYPGTYEIQLNEPGVFTIQGAKVKGHELKYTITHTVTKSETLNLEISSLKKVEPKKGKK
jgi:hypothetical protein